MEAAKTKKVANPYLVSNARKAKPQQADALLEKFELPAYEEKKAAPQDREVPKEPEEKKEADPAVEPSKPNTGLAFWERLPSKNLTFGPAEILTVKECCKHFSLYEGKAVRVTGQLRQRGFVGDDVTAPRQVFLELIEPTSFEGFGSGSKSRRISAPSHPATTPAKSSLSSTLGAQKTPFKTPTLGLRNPILGISTGKSSLSKRRKRPWFGTSAIKQTPPKCDTSATFYLKVLVDPELPHLSDIVPSGATKVTVIGTLVENGTLQARLVVKLDSTMNMELYAISLQSRRRYLYRRHVRLREEVASGGGDQTTNEGGESLIQGCGPPPYKELLFDGDMK